MHSCSKGLRMQGMGDRKGCQLTPFIFFHSVLYKYVCTRVVTETLPPPLHNGGVKISLYNVETDVQQLSQQIPQGAHNLLTSERPMVWYIVQCFHKEFFTPTFCGAGGSRPHLCNACMYVLIVRKTPPTYGQKVLDDISSEGKNSARSRQTSY